MKANTTLRRRPGRPPKRVAGQLETREALVRCGTAVFTEKGFAQTGIDEVLRAVGVPKGSFYHYFDSKEAFGRAVIDQYAAYFARKLDRCLLDPSRPPLARVQAFVEDACAGMARHGFRRGCLIGNLGQEMAVLPESFRTRLEEVFLDWQARLAACLRAARQCGEIAPQADCEALAAFFWIGWEGAVLRAKLVRSDAPLRLFAAGFLAGLPR
ncbi:TetR/AcrR family transcriptional regulator [Pseudothauera hydrothermalis]|jgi:TetR/AcrR family transcriptional repressor of nem operon|uniref:acrylate utilization transcriptional regulator AcuR n=1 Tax=Pseudothauera hydrothermalis TaxID=2184083 RepID=UPI000C7C532B|nr:TetR/AcrR family transcriptional regulator [Pseudothauera hydrothermalis]AUM01222.1 TetR family transcriptional regulator [Rhodocyclaceae bacterium]